MAARQRSKERGKRPKRERQSTVAERHSRVATRQTIGAQRQHNAHTRLFAPRPLPYDRRQPAAKASVHSARRGDTCNVQAEAGGRRSERAAVEVSRKAAKAQRKDLCAFAALREICSFR